MKGDLVKIFVTGATGFIGSQVVRKITQLDKFSVLGVAHRKDCEFPPSVGVVKINDLNDSCLFDGLDDIGVVLHLAAMAGGSLDKKSEMEKVNIDATLNLARQAAEHGVKRFVFMSSVKVSGEQTSKNHPFTENDLSCPIELYGETKWSAEQGLRKISQETGMSLVIIRPPLVYGYGVKGNFANLIGLVETALPLPLGAINNKRSLVGIDNLVDFIITCIDHPAAVNQTFLVADGEDLSTTDLLRKLAKAMGKPSRLFPVPVSFLEFVAKLLGKQSVAQRLLGSLQVDISKARNLLGWTPPVSVDEGLRRCVVGRSHNDLKSSGKVLRFFDAFFAAVGLFIGFPVFVLLTVVGLFDTGSPIFCQERVGKGKRPFILVKFRTMKLDTASVASHLASASSITKFGNFLRKTKLDELPQLWNVLKGEMSLVGPRPCLFNQGELINERDRRGVYAVRPGITGLAQVNEIDMSTPELLAETDARMIREMSVSNYFKFILQTVTGKGSGDRVKKG